MLLWQYALPRFIKNTPYFLKDDYRYTLKKKHSQFCYVQHTIAVAPRHITCHPNQDAVLTFLQCLPICSHEHIYLMTACTIILNEKYSRRNILAARDVLRKDSNKANTRNRNNIMIYIDIQRAESNSLSYLQFSFLVYLNANYSNHCCLKMQFWTVSTDFLL